MTTKWRRSVISVGLVAFILLSSTGVPVYSSSVEDLQDQIDEQNDSLTDVYAQLEAAQQHLDAINNQLANTQGELPRLEAEINQLEAEIAFNTLQVDVLSKEQGIKELEREQKQEAQDDALTTAYVLWRSNNELGDYLLSTNSLHPMKHQTYQSAVLTSGNHDLAKLAELLEKIKADIADFASKTEELEAKNSELAQRKQQLEAQILALRYSYNNANGAVSGLRAESAVIQANIAQLTAEQQALLQYEAWLLQQPGDNASQPIGEGEYYFSGRGRDAYQGHGVGLSQFGAYGAAQNGWSADQILTFYYTDTHIEERAGSVDVQGYGWMDANAYVAGLGEIPSKACGTAEQAASNPAKYVVDNPNTVWDCWPEEAIKAQVIAARSYALTYGSTICTTAACQVYVGGTAKQWAADETANKVVVSHGSTHTGQIIRALYSSDNYNGWGTANNDTVWSNQAGDGTPYSYLRAVQINSNDTYHYTYTDWTWRTNSYTVDELEAMLLHVNQDASLAYAHSYVAAIMNDIGNDLAALTFDRDPSGRVKKVIPTGTNGVSRPIAGWLFKTAWNSWVYNVQPSGQIDYIYSLSYFLLSN